MADDAIVIEDGEPWLDDDCCELAVSEDRDLIAAELEPVFAAIWRGDVDDAQVRLRRLPSVLDGSDPILLALQRAKARPMLFAA